MGGTGSHGGLIYGLYIRESENVHFIQAHLDQGMAHVLQSTLYKYRCND